MAKKEIGIIGLGKFGLELGKTLTRLGHKVLGLDSSEDLVREADGLLSVVYSGSGTNKETLRQLRFQDLDYVVVSVGSSMEDSILIVLNLQEIQAKTIIAKAVSPQHATVLSRLGVKHVVQPERDAAIQEAHKIDKPGMIDLLPAGGGLLLQELNVKAWAGKTLRELALPTKNKVMVVARKLAEADEYVFVPDPDAVLQAHEILLVIGKPEEIVRLRP